MPTNRFWLVVGTSQNWHTAFDYHGIWGLRPSQKRYWDEMKENRDVIFFYVNSPVSGIVGSGIVRTKLHQHSPLWPEERAENAVIWPFRFEFDVLSCLPPQSWKDQRVTFEGLKSRVRSGFQQLEPNLAADILRMLPQSRPDGLILPHTSDTLAPLHLAVPSSEDRHGYTQSLLAEIGRLQSFITDIEFPLDNRRVDVVWRRVQRSAPSYAFEVQIAGNITEAVAKLKQAFDVWNSKIFLVGKPEHRSSSQQLCDGPFHEIRERLRFLAVTDVEELYRRKLAYRELEHHLGILHS